MIYAVVLVGAAGLVNLILTYGVIRRLREHTQLLAGPPAEPGPAWPAVGTEVGEFRATTTTGLALQTSDLAEGTVAGFFRTGCDPCAERLPEFIAYAAEHADPSRFLAVLLGDPGELAGKIRDLTPVARVVLTERDSDLLTAFRVNGYPALVRLGPGQLVAASGWEMPALQDDRPALAS